jgi:hypothetical protein
VSAAFSERLAKLATATRCARVMRRAEERLIEDAARAWRPDLDWGWNTGRGRGFVAHIAEGLLLCADVCAETGQFRAELDFEAARTTATREQAYQCANETRTHIMAAGLGATLADAYAVALANYNEARAVVVPDAGAALAVMGVKL